jgi:vanillate O-demethylase ferredoxin subunit
LRLRVARVQAEALDVLRIELVDEHGRELPPFEPGAHLRFTLPNGLQRQYSLCGDWRERRHYVVGVGRAPASRGGSAWIHGSLREGMHIDSSAPVNQFRLQDASAYLFIAGGIGITPILAMVRWCAAHGKPWRLVYAARSRQRLAFYEDLREHGDLLRIHCDDEAGAPLAVTPLLEVLEPGTEVYCCGPAPLMRAAQANGTRLPASALHFEWFSAPTREQPAGTDGFWIDLKRSGTSLRVPPQLSILDVLEANGHEVPFSCREGLCGTCETVVCEGEPEHLDYVFPPSQREGLRSMLICVSRAKSPRLVLDL